MAEYEAIVMWQRNGAQFTDNRYSRRHVWEFDGGAQVLASSSPHGVAIPLSDPSAVDPEEAFVAALASCHMLWFLSIAAKHGYCVQSYRDRAVGIMSTNSLGKLAVTSVTLNPHAEFTSEFVPTADVVHAMHEAAHEECYIARSVKTEVTTQPTFNVIAGAGDVNI
jgi:organic hydroperoxide reductase OsmC/OhrA